MIRSRKQQQSTGNSTGGGSSSSRNNDDNGNYPNGHPHQRRRSHSKTQSSCTFPTPLIGALIASCILSLLLVLSGSLPPFSSSGESRGAGGDPVDSRDGDQVVNDDDDRSNNKKKLRRVNPVSSLSAANNVRNGDSNSDKSHLDVDATETTSPTTGSTLHIVFSTDCSPYQQWQSYLFFHRAYTIHQPGYITRIVSGCVTEQEIQDETAWHETHIANAMSDRYKIHFTPHYSGVRDEQTGKVIGDYKYFNKPFGLKHFLEENESMGFLAEGEQTVETETNVEKEMKHPNDIIILCDPDFALLRPITDDFSDPRETIVSARRKKYFDAIISNNGSNSSSSMSSSSHIVTHGHPYAQTYGLGTQWRTFHLEEITGMSHSPARDVNQQDGGLFYPVGPPYIATVRDMYQIAIRWSKFVPRVYEEYPHLLAEMYAYCIAAAHLQLPHTLIDSMMISNPGVGGEGWKYIKDIPESETCSFAMNPNHSVRPVPTLLHYCQRYQVDGYFWAKRQMPKTIFTCNHPLLEEPPIDLLGVHQGKGGNGEEKKERKKTEKDKMNAFMVCALTKFTNDAMIFFKDHHCEKDGGGNRTRLKFHQNGKLS